MTNDAAGAAWRAELERRHAYLANVIDQACAWAREFHVPVCDEPWGNGSSVWSYPLTAYADRLDRISTALKMACANASLDPPDPGWDRTTLRSRSMVAVPGRDPDWQPADYSEGGQYLLGLESGSRHIVTAQDHWRAALRLAGPSVIERELGVPQLETYAAQAQSLFDSAYMAVRSAYRDSVAATFGRFWATWTDEGHSSAAPLIAWMRSLTDFGFSVKECESVLHDIQLADPMAVAKCREQWLSQPS
ncbi:hypothetical protein ACP6C7_06180 [Mycolicibacterium septicum]|uniref:Uncharacterized protein n=1 Tax=Mycolicibacterium septicum TaxID=98668 RepID=A0ABW9LMJ9_9MYCO